MTPFQVGAIALLVASLAWVYVPRLSFSLPQRKPSVMKQIAAVIGIRDEASSPEVKTACNALLQALLR
jgi:hypothetical protein